jgi:diguanylate cyclase (GGDEF)-like protein
MTWLRKTRAKPLNTSDPLLQLIESLARAIDAKDNPPLNHIRRVKAFAVGLSRELGMSADETDAVLLAALLHDVGKLAVPEYILSKPGPLTQEEFQKIRIHPQVGAAIISGAPLPYPVAPLILSHHERFDGKGYPSGLKGEQIPLGARILSVVDYFDALTSDRPYHKAMTYDAAVALLRRESGGALDPHVVEAFIRIYPKLATEAADTDKAQENLGLPTEDIALANREIYALYEIAQAMGTSLGVADTMALVSSKLSNILPFSSCALFLFNEENDSLRCRFANGLDAELIRQLAMPNGQGLQGWVARNRRPLVNARPRADLEAAGLTELTSLQSSLIAPLLFNERFIGTIAVYHTVPSIFTDDHRRLLDRTSEQAAAVIYNSIIFEQAQEDAFTDWLTGLPNVRFMFLHLRRELARAERLKSEMSLLLMDMDDFKAVNTAYGDSVGDRALCEVAALLRTGIRPYDICVRYFSDKFIVVLSGCGVEEADRKRHELEQAVNSIQFTARPSERVPLAIKIGAATYPHDGDSYESLLAAADRRMRHHKKRPSHDPSVQRRSVVDDSQHDMIERGYLTSTSAGRGLAKVAGMHALKQLLRDEVIDVVRNPELYRRYRVAIPNGILLYGPPGCGKTYIARQLAEELGYHFREVIPSELASPYIHDTVKRIGQLFQAAIEHAPAIVFIDEFEALAPARSDLGGHQHYKAEEVNEFLAQLNNCAEKNVLVIAATNRPEKIDPAVRRTGRLDKLIYVGPPDLAARKEMLELHLLGRPVTPLLVVERVAEALDGYSASDIRVLVDNAARLALQKRQEITEDLLCVAMEAIPPSVTRGIEAQYRTIEQRGS